MKHACLTRPFIEEATQKGQRKEHCMCIKQKQNISSQSLLRNPSKPKSSFQFVWLQAMCQAMLMYWAYLVSGFTEPLLFDDVLGTHHHVLSLRHPVHQSGRHRHRVLQGRHLGPPVQTERKKLSMLCNGHSLCHIDIMSSTLLVIYSPCLSNGFSGSQNDHQGFSVKAFLLQQEY